MTTRHEHPDDASRIAKLERKSIEYRRAVLRFIMDADAGHTGGSLSAVDILNVLYNAVMNIRPENWDSLDRDHYVQSKGHSVEALYVVLADRGFIPPQDLSTGARYQSHLIGHPTRKVPGVEHNTGGLGHGLGVSVGLALAAKLAGRGSRVYCLLGDGELAEGSNWEAAMSASHFGLENLMAIIDRNRLQITGDTEDVMALEPLAEKWASFGWTVRRVDGHDLRDLTETLGSNPSSSRPTAVIAETVKGRGISFIEGEKGWHHRVPSRQEFERAVAELDSRLSAIETRSPSSMFHGAGAVAQGTGGVE